jgi:catechol 2,3-dioxygenase-like lactoylglutathione lyase family enzyme
MITRVAHNAIKVTDMGKSLHFYCDILGAKKAFEINNEKNEPWIVYLKVGDSQFIELFYGGVADPASKYAPVLIGYHHYCLTTDDFPGIAGQLCTNGVINREQADGGIARSNLWVHDPDGNAVEIVKYNPVGYAN